MKTLLPAIKCDQYRIIHQLLVVDFIVIKMQGVKDEIYNY